MAVAHEPEDRADVVAEDDLHEERAVDEPRALEELLVLRRALLCRQRAGRVVRPVLVEQQELRRDVLHAVSRG